MNYCYPDIMQKTLLTLLALTLLGACNRPNPDFIALEKTFMQPGVEVIGPGLPDTVFIRIPATDEIKSIAAHGKNTVFWSGLASGNILEHVKTETCLINAKTDYVGKCPYRLYCGGAVELMIAMAVNTVYATEICK